MLRTKKLSDKILVLGVDGLDPRFSKYMIEKGKMPNLEKLIAKGSAREDLMLLGGSAPVTPPGWTTLSTGAYSYTHGICQFFPLSAENYQQGYNLHSGMSKAEAAWNGFAEAGLKTCVFHWPGCSWPPTSDSENLYVIDGSVPGTPGSAVYLVQNGFFFGANGTDTEPKFVVGSMEDIAAPCVVKEVPGARSGSNGNGADVPRDAGFDPQVLLGLDEGWSIRKGRYQQPYDVAQSYLRPAQGWANAPEDALEFVVYLHNSMVRRPGLVLKNAEGKYDSVAIYKSKKDVEPMAVIKDKEYYRNFIDDGYQKDERCVCSRDIYVQEIDPEGKNVRMYFTIAMRIDSSIGIHPGWLHDELMENVGPYAPSEQFYGQNEEHQLIQLLAWEHAIDWYVDAIHYLIEKQDMQVFFSHMHSVDLMMHTFIRYLVDQGYNEHPTEHIEWWAERVYDQCDRYIGKFLHLLDEDWTIIVTSDHGLVCPWNEPPAIGDMCGINAGLMSELGYTVLQKDENGNNIAKIDWTKTKAIADQGGNIWINLKGRSPYGIVEPEDKYELEEQIITDLMGYKHPKTGKRVLAVVLRNKDAIMLGYGGDTAGDIFTANAEGYNFDHTDGLMTNYGANHTSLSPIFIAAGKGIKEGYTIPRMIRQVDVAPTMCALAGVRFPAMCEGAPMYPIFTEEV